MNNLSADAIVAPPRHVSHPDREHRGDVQGEGADDRRGRAVGERRDVEEALVEHEASAVLALLAGLEHEQHPAGELAGTVGEQAGGADEHRRVGVVPAGVHLVVVLRGEVEPGVLGERQRVHVAAQQHRRPRLAAGQQRRHAARGLVHGDVEGQRFDRRQHLLLGDRQVVADLGPAVQRAAQLDGAGQRARRLVAQRLDVDPLSPLVLHVSTHGVDGKSDFRFRPQSTPRAGSTAHGAPAEHEEASMPAGMYGADPEQLSALGSKLVAQNEPIAQIQSVVMTTLAGTTWQGPARDRFEAEWNDQFNPALNALKDAFTAAGNECTQRGRLADPGDGRGRLTASSGKRSLPARASKQRTPSVDPLRLTGVQALEFTIEPFVEGNPGPHVRAAVAAVESLGATVDFGPFGSTCEASAAAMPEIVAAVVKEAFANGATHVSLHISTTDAEDRQP